MPRNDNPFFDSMNNAIDNLVPLALKKWQIDQDKAIAAERLGIEEARWEAAARAATEKLGQDNFKEKLKMAVENGQPDLIRGMEATGELRKYAGMERWPRKRSIVPGDSADNPLYQETDELQMPMSKEDKLLEMEGRRDARLDRRLAEQGSELDKRLAAQAGRGEKESWHDSGRTDEEGYPVLVSNKGNMKRGTMLAGTKPPAAGKKADTEKLNSTIVLNNDNWQVVAPMAENFNKTATDASWSFWEGEKGGVVKIAYGIDSNGNQITNADIQAEAKRSGKSFGDVVGQLQKKGMAQYVEMPKPAKK